MTTGCHDHLRKACNPVLIELTRGPRIESVHRGAAAVMTAAGEVLTAWGDIDRPVFVRSAAKPLQALALVETGAADAFAVTAAELALACGSHSGEPRHVAGVSGWLARLGLDSGALVCGPHPPLDPHAAADLVRAGALPTPIHNNCSGKHAGFLTAARHLGLPLRRLRGGGASAAGAHPPDPRRDRRRRRSRRHDRRPTAAASPPLLCRCARWRWPLPGTPGRRGCHRGAPKRRSGSSRP